MIAVLQRVLEARVVVDERIVGEIGYGILALVAVAQDDTQEDMQWMANKLGSIRMFRSGDGEKHFELDVREVKGGIVVANRNGGNLRIGVEKDVAVRICDVVAIALLIVCHHVQAAHIEHSIKVGDGFLALRPWNGSPDPRPSRLVGEEGCGERRTVMFDKQIRIALAGIGVRDGRAVDISSYAVVSDWLSTAANRWISCGNSAANGVNVAVTASRPAAQRDRMPARNVAMPNSKPPSR